jgi:hypothetical protein
MGLLIKFLDILNASIKINCVIFLVTSIMLFFREHLIKFWGFDRYISLIPWVFTIFLISGIFLIVEMVRLIFTRFQKIIETKQRKKKLIKRLFSLTNEERKHLEFFILGNRRTGNFSEDDDIMQGLEKEEMLIRLAELRENRTENLITYQLADCIWNYLQDHPELIIDSTFNQMLVRSNRS